MEASIVVIQKIKEFEGLRLEAYRDAAGVLTIGYGHTGADVLPGDKISRYWADELLRDDVERLGAEVRRLKVAHTQGQFDALLSFAYNLGTDRLSRSTLLKTIRSGGSRNAIRKEFMRWVYAGGKKLGGLERRRKWEAKRFFE